MTPEQMRRLAREKIRDGLLPCSEHPQTWGGPGSGSHCSLCDTMVQPEHTELEVDVSDRRKLVVTTLRFHVPCHRAWVEECDAVPTARRAG